MANYSLGKTFPQKVMGWLGLSTATVLILTGLASFGLPASSYMLPAVSIMVAFVLFITVGTKRLTNISSIQKLEFQEYLVGGIGVILLINGVLTLPILEITFAPIQAIAGFTILIAGILVALSSLRLIREGR